MSRHSNQDLKLLYLADYLQRETDEFHPVSAKKILSYLEQKGISLERKALYNSFEALRYFGMDIRMVRAPGAAYYLASRPFEIAELKLLVDSIQSSRFITERKTAALIRKLESLASVHEARDLQRQVIVRGRIKSMNESVFSSVDALSVAINENKSVRFQYMGYNIRKETQLRRNGASYHVSPFAMIWDNENYYLLGYDEEDGIMKHFRVDRISSIRMTDDCRNGQELFDKIDLGTYTSQVFGMFHGEERQVRVLFANHLIGAAIDRFGKSIRVIPYDADHFSVLVPVTVSPQFFAWVFSFGEEATILEPEEIRNQYKEYLEKAISVLTLHKSR